MKTQCVLGLVATVLVGCVGSSPKAGPETVVFEESFDESLDSDWFWVRGTSAAQRLEHGRIFLLTEPGGLFRDHNDGKNLLLRALPPSTEPLLVEVDLTLEPEGLYENAGIILYIDDDNYAVVNKESYPDHEPSLRLQVAYESNGEPEVPHDTHYERSRVILGMRIGGSSITGLYRSSTSEPWTVLGSVPRPVGSTPRIGLKTSYGVQGVERWAEFDNFRISVVQ